MHDAVLSVVVVVGLVLVSPRTILLTPRRSFPAARRCQCDRDDGERAIAARVARYHNRGIALGTPVVDVRFTFAVFGFVVTTGTLALVVAATTPVVLALAPVVFGGSRRLENGPGSVRAGLSGARTRSGDARVEGGGAGPPIGRG